MKMLTIQSDLDVKTALAVALVAADKTQQQEVIYDNKKYMVMNAKGIMTIVKRP